MLNDLMIMLTVAALMLVSCAAGPAAFTPTGQRIRLDVVEPQGAQRDVADWPVSVGAVFPEGELTSSAGRIVDDAGNVVPHETDVTGWWDADRKHIKWLLFHFRASTGRTYHFEPGSGAGKLTGLPIAQTVGDRIEVNTGPLRARVSAIEPTLFESVTLRGKPMLTGGALPHVVTALVGEDAQPGRVVEWDAILEHASPARATVKATGLLQRAGGEPLARVDLRYQFFRGESFVRLYHTVTWMIRDPQIGARELALRFDPAIGDVNAVRVGIDGKPVEVSGVNVTLHQDEAEHLALYGGEKKMLDGRQIDGYLALDGDKRSISVALRHAWQNYPTAFKWDGKRLSVQFWPDRGKAMSFMPRDIMGDRIYFHPTWKKYPFSREKGHFVNNYEDSPYFAYTAEGAAWTHELLVGFHDERSTRDAEQLNDLTQRPLALRQDPEAAMRVPFMGFDLMPYDADATPEVERAVDWLGRLSMARWISENNYGMLRFGMVRWSKHGDYTYYRWMDNGQYDQQVIPWMLFMRGGDRRFFDDGEITSRYCMDLCINHYNTRDSPTGYVATCGGSMPFPNFAFMRWNLKGQKLHFLSYYWHMTGYPRAKDVLDEVINGTIEYARDDAEKHGPLGLVGGREMYNMNRFWALAYQETLDPEVAQFAANSRQVSIEREYNAEENTWGGPKVYLYNGLVAQDVTFDDPALRDVMVSHLSRSMLDQPGGGIGDPTDVIATGWARRETGDARFGEIGWDVARGLADLVPEIDLETENVPFYPYAYLGNAILRMHVLPMLVGSAEGRRAGLDAPLPLRFHDLFLFLAKGDPWRSEAFVDSQGGTAVRVLVRGRGEEPFTLTIENAAGQQVLQTTLAPGADQVIKLDGAGVHRVVLSRDVVGTACLLSDAPLVWHTPLDQSQANESFSGGQGYTPLRLYARATGGPVGYYNRQGRPYAIHNAQTGELLLRGETYQRDEVTAPVEAGTMIAVTVRGSRAQGEWKLTGVEPYISARPDGWFDPRP